MRKAITDQLDGCIVLNGQNTVIALKRSTIL